MFHFYTTWKHLKTGHFLMFSVIKKWNMGWKWVNTKAEKSSFNCFLKITPILIGISSGDWILSKKRLWHGCFPVNFVKISRTLISIEHLWWLLLRSVGPRPWGGKLLKNRLVTKVKRIVCSAKLPQVTYKLRNRKRIVKEYSNNNNNSNKRGRKKRDIYKH